MAHKEDLRVPALTPLWVVIQEKGALASLTLYVLNTLASLAPSQGRERTWATVPIPPPSVTRGKFPGRGFMVCVRQAGTCYLQPGKACAVTSYVTPLPWTGQ